MERLTSDRPWEEAKEDLVNELGYSFIWQRLNAIEKVLGKDYDLDRLKEIVEAYKATEKRPSNGDMFRKMTDEKLAHYFSITFANGFGEGNFLEWLKAPANDEVWKNFKEDAG